jgi:hypothetical protein
MAKSNRTSAAWRRAVRLAALALLALIAHDLQDSGCEPLVASRPLALAETPRDAAPADACAGGCVPDCFCCSMALPALELQPLLPAVAVAGWVDSVPASPALGFSSHPDHVPIA